MTGHQKRENYYVDMIIIDEIIRKICIDEFMNYELNVENFFCHEHTLIFFVFSRTQRSRLIFSPAKVISLTRATSAFNLCSHA